MCPSYFPNNRVHGARKQSFNFIILMRKLRLIWGWGTFLELSCGRTKFPAPGLQRPASFRFLWCDFTGWHTETFHQDSGSANLSCSFFQLFSKNKLACQALMNGISARCPPLVSDQVLSHLKGYRNSSSSPQARAPRDQGSDANTQIKHRRGSTSGQQCTETAGTGSQSHSL